MNESSQPAKQKNNTTALIIVLILVIFVLYRCGGGGSSDDGPTVRATSRPAATSAPETITVSYAVTGTAGRADLTYRNASGGTEQKEVTLPWTLKLDVPPGQFVYLSAQSLKDGNADISCRITVNGVPIQVADSSGEYVIATCSGSAGD